MILRLCRSLKQVKSHTESSNWSFQNDFWPVLNDHLSMITTPVNRHVVAIDRFDCILFHFQEFVLNMSVLPVHNYIRYCRWMLVFCCTNTCSACMTMSVFVAYMYWVFLQIKYKLIRQTLHVQDLSEQGYTEVYFHIPKS